MENYSEHLNRITEEIDKTLNNNFGSDIHANTIIDTEEYVKLVFGDDPNIKYEISVSGKEGETKLVDVNPKNLYTSCKFLGFEVPDDCPEVGEVVFDRVTIIYNHIEGMQILPKDPLDNLDDIIPVF